MLSEYEEEYDLYWELNLYLGHAYLLKDNYDKALEYLQQAYSLNPVDYKGTWLLARAYLGADNDTEMVAYYDKAILLADDQEELDVRREYFDVLLSEQQYARAEEQLDEIIAGDEDESYYYNIVWADSLLDRGLNNKVEEQLNVLDFDEISNSLKPEYYYLQAGVEYGNADWDKALASIESSIELDDNLAKYRLMKGLILYELGRDEEAESELERAIDLDLVGDVSAEAVKTLDRI
jgi:tetratricopeptide (TPR) repeat protein